MHLAELIQALDGCLADPQAHWSRIVELLWRHRSLPEFEVARCYVTPHVRPSVEALLASLDPRDRLRGVQTVLVVYGRAQAAQALRHRVKDPDPRVATAARRVVELLDLGEVALPDTRAQAAQPPPPGRRVPGRWDPSGWLFGRGSARDRTPGPGRSQPERPDDLPALATAADVAALLGVDARGLARLLRPGSGRGAAYVEFEVPKASGGARRIATPRPRLKKAQRVILREIVGRIAPHDAAHGFVRGRSVVTNARPHEGARVVVKMDLRDFFPSVHFRRVRGLFERYGYPPAAAMALAGLTTYRPTLAGGEASRYGVLAQGAPTSPAIANLVCRRLDHRLAALASRFGAAYTRYADDLTFSFREEPARLGRFLWWADQVCQQEGFCENAAKRRVLRAGRRQRVTGLVVNRSLAVPREARRRFRATLENCRRHGVDSQARGRPRFREYLRGFASYVKMVQPEEGRALVEEVRALLAADRGGAP